MTENFSYTETTNKLDAKFNKSLQKLLAENIDDIFPACTMVVLQKGEKVLEFASGWIDPEQKQHPTQIDSLFDLASVTKLFVETAFLALVSQGKVALDDPLVTVIPEFGDVTPRSMDGGQDPHSKVQLPTPKENIDQTVDPAQVTFYQLLTHTSGLAAWRDVFNQAGVAPLPPTETDPISREIRWKNAVHALCNYPFVGQPGDAIRYSDLGLLLLGKAVSRLQTGQSGNLQQAVKELVLQPLNLQSVTYNPMQHGISRTQIVPTEDDPTWRKRRCWGEVHDENACGVGGVAGHAGLFATAEDVAQFGQAWLMQDERLKIVPEWMQEAITEQVAEDGRRHGLGWMLKFDTDPSCGTEFHADSFGHTGFTGTSLWVEPQRKIVVACLTNRVYVGREVPGIHTFRQTVHDIIAHAVDRLA